MTVQIEGIETYQVSEDGMSVEIRWPTASDTRLTAGEVELIIRRLGAVRGQMLPAVPIDAAENIEVHPLQSLFVRHTSTEHNPAKNGAVILARSAQFGWMEYPISPEMCQGLANWFAAHPEAICAPSGTSFN
jgi:hypothetical protein